MSRRRIVLATFNRDKVRELRELIAHVPVEVVGLFDVPGAAPPPERGDTVRANALEKALAARALTGELAIADDTALEVDALGGRPGVHAARFAGPGASYADNVRKLLAELEGQPPAARTARFRTSCVACFPEGGDAEGEGVLEGRITLAPRGGHGFGYDPVFEVEGTGLTLAELDSAQKNAMSHRARAIHALIPKLGLDREVR